MVPNKVTGLIVILLLAFPGCILGEETTGIEVNVNSSDVEGKFDFRFQRYKTNIIAGAGIVYSDDNHLVANLNLSLKDQAFVKPLSIGVGFKGLLGTAETNKTDYDMGAVGFFLSGEYDFRKHEDRLKIPISLYSSLSFAPEPLCFIDSKQYIDFSFTVYGHLLKNASILAGYRHLDFRFEKIADTISKTDDALYVGCKLHF